MDPVIAQCMPWTMNTMRMVLSMGGASMAPSESHRNSQHSKKYEFEDYRSAANGNIKKGKYEEAIELYNKCLRHAQAGSKDISLAYYNRSKIYFETGKYALAVENIELARKNGFPADKMADLESLEEKYKEMIEKFGPDKNVEAREFFKLSHPPNEKIPFIAGCLELRKNDRYGRHIVTTQGLKTGDIIAIESPVHAWHNDSIPGSACFFCLKTRNGSLIPCSHCFAVMFCSEECRNKAAPLHLHKKLWKTTGGMFEKSSLKMQLEAFRVAGGVDELLELLKESEGKTIFDFDFSDPDEPNCEKNMLIALNGLNKNVRSFETMEAYADQVWNMPPVNEKKRTAGQRKNLKKFIESQFQINVSNLASHAGSHAGIYLFKSLTNHSCFPNVLFLKYDEKLVCIVTRPIKAGEQLFDCYGAHVIAKTRARRHEDLQKYQFKCECEACANNWPQKFPRKNRRFIEPKLEKLKPAESIEQFKENCTYIDKNAGKIPCYEVQKLMEHNAILALNLADVKMII